MPIVLSVGQGVKNPQAQRFEGLPSLHDALDALPALPELWWSGHLWRGNYRKTDNWEGASAITVDVDYRGELDIKKKRGFHVAPPNDVRAIAEQILNQYPALFSVWHHTPRGLRICIELPEIITDPQRVLRIQLGAEACIRHILSEAGIGAVNDCHGYAPDEQCRDLAHLMFAPRAIVGGHARQGVLHQGQARPSTLDTFELEGKKPRAAAASLAGPAHSEDDIAGQLKKMPSDGENDGSNALMRVARRAVGLGVETPEEFCRVAYQWNDKRKRPWSDEELSRRFSDALARWEAEGKAKVPIGKYTLHALGKILREDRDFSGRLLWDVRDEVVMHWSNLGRWEAVNDVYITGIRQRIIDRYGYSQVPKEDAAAALRLAADARSYDRVAEYIAGLPAWDGVERMELLSQALRMVNPDRALSTSYVRCTLIAAVARTHRPGTKHDHVLVLVGPEGRRKSTAFRILAGPENFNDTQIDISTKDGYMQIASAWIHEWGELEAYTRKADSAHLKNFLSSSVDRYRAPYGRVVEPHLRRCIFVGSSNTPDLIHDPDSDRRWWISTCSRDLIDVEWIAANRDQLWAEALHLYAEHLADEKAGLPAHKRRGKWWLEPQEEERRRAANEDHRPDNPREDAISTAVLDMEEADSYQGMISSVDLYIRIGLDVQRVSGADRAAVSAAMRRLGYARRRVRGDDGKRRHIWVRYGIAES